jgi:hypothetical protein
MSEEPQTPIPEEKLQTGWSLTRLAGLLLLLLAVVAAVYIAVGYFAWQSGQDLRAERLSQQKSEQLIRQVSLAQEDIAGGSYNLAIHRLDWVLERDAGNSEAAALRLQAQAALKTALTPAAPPSPSPPPEPTMTPGDVVDPAAELARLGRLDNRGQWAELLAGALTLQRQFPDFERLETDRLLYDAYLNLGLQNIQGTQIETGINYLSQAEKLGDLPQEALDYWLWAELYLEGIAYFGVNWGVASSVLRDLCLSAPFYQNACDRLFEALLAQADQYRLNGDFCPAVDFYREARQHGDNATLGQRLTDSVEGCALATPTPLPITDTLPITGTEVLPLPDTNE